MRDKQKVKWELITVQIGDNMRKYENVYMTCGKLSAIVINTLVHGQMETGMLHAGYLKPR